MAIILRYTDWYFLDPSVFVISFLSYRFPRFGAPLRFSLDAVPEGADIVKNTRQLDNVASINQLNGMDHGWLGKNAIVHVCSSR